MTMSDDTLGAYLRESDFATKLTPGGSVPNGAWTNDQIAQYLLRERRLLVDTEAGIVVRADGITRAETPKPTGYGTVYLGRWFTKVRWSPAHRIVWIAKYGPIPGMYEVNHRNGHRWDNRVCNLEMATHADNMRHAFRQRYQHIDGDLVADPDDRPGINPISSSADRMAFVRAKRAH